LGVSVSQYNCIDITTLCLYSNGESGTCMTFLIDFPSASFVCAHYSYALVVMRMGKTAKVAYSIGP
jgi:hypothetical protein